MKKIIAVTVSMLVGVSAFGQWKTQNGVKLYIDENDWRNDLHSGYIIHGLNTTASNVRKADEVTSTPGDNEQLGNRLTFDKNNTGFKVSFDVYPSESGAGFTFNDTEGSGNEWNNALSVGDVDNYDNDNFYWRILGGDKVYALGLELRENEIDSGEMVRIKDGSTVLAEIDTSDMPYNTYNFIGIISAQPFNNFWFNEGNGGDDMAIANFRIAVLRDISLTIESEHGSPQPPVGTHIVDYGTMVIYSVEDTVEVGSTQYVSLGSSEGGATNWFTSPATENTTVTWEWATNYWVSASVSGSGTVTVAAQPPWSAPDSVGAFIPAGSNVAVSATPDPDWLFMGWGGDLSGDYTVSNQNLLVDAPKAFIATFSEDADGDGLLNSNEWAIGTNPRNGDTDGDNFGDGFEVANGGSPTVSHNPYMDFVRNNGGIFGLYESNVVVDVAVGQLALETSGGMADLSLQLMKSDDLTTWTNAAPPVEWSIPVETNQQFFRVRAEP